MEPRERRSNWRTLPNERDILKVDSSLFLDELRAEFEHAKTNKAELRRFHEKLASLRFLDPACGCGNFLYCHLSRIAPLGIRNAKRTFIWQAKPNQSWLEINRLSQVDVDAFYRHRDRRMARAHRRSRPLADGPSDEPRTYPKRSGSILPAPPAREIPDHRLRQRVCELDWKSHSPDQENATTSSGTPLSSENIIGSNTKIGSWESCPIRKYWEWTMSGWFERAAQYIRGTGIKVGFVATNSITQGEQGPFCGEYYLTASA